MIVKYVASSNKKRNWHKSSLVSAQPISKIMETLRVTIAVARKRASRRDSCDAAIVLKDKDDWEKYPHISIPKDAQAKTSMNLFAKKTKIVTSKPSATTKSKDSSKVRKHANYKSIPIESDVQKLVMQKKLQNESSMKAPLKTKRTKLSEKTSNPDKVNIDATSASDIVLTGRFKGDKQVEQLNVAESQPGSWTSKDLSDTKMNVKRRNSTAAMSLYDEEQSPMQIDGKRRNSLSALASLSLGELQLSPFLKKSPVYKSRPTSKKNSSRRLLDLPLPLSDEDTMSSSGRKVAFVVQSDGSIQTKIAESILTLSEEEVKTLWWSKPERRAMKRKAQKIAIKFLSVTAKYHLAVEQILSQCGKSAREKKDCQLYFSEREALRFLIHHDARGLELAMIASLSLPSCKTYHKSCKNSVKEVLNTQAMWKGSSRKTVDQQAQMIATQYRKASEMATCFARILAEGDVRVARGAYVQLDRGDETSILTPALTEESSLSTSSSDEDFLDGSITI